MHSSFQAATAGAKDQEAVNFLEKKVKGAEPLPYAEAVQLAIGALQNVLSEDFKATDIEVFRLQSQRVHVSRTRRLEKLTSWQTSTLCVNCCQWRAVRMPLNSLSLVIPLRTSAGGGGAGGGAGWRLPGAAHQRGGRAPHSAQRA